MRINDPKYDRDLRMWPGTKPGFYFSNERWPWQIRESAALMSGSKEKVGEKYGWKPTAGTGRFGGGWNWNISLRIGRESLHFELLFGIVTIGWRSKEQTKFMLTPRA